MIEIFHGQWGAVGAFLMKVAKKNLGAKPLSKVAEIQKIAACCHTFEQTSPLPQFRKRFVVNDGLFQYAVAIARPNFSSTFAKTPLTSGSCYLIPRKVVAHF